MRSRFPLALLFALGACQQDPVLWNDGAERQALVPPTSAQGDSILHATLRAAVPPPRSDVTIPPAAVLGALGAPCTPSVRVAIGRGAERMAAWWALRGNGRAVLLASRSPDGGQAWEAPARVDTLDVSASGCDRPAPAVTLDSANGYTHIAYSIEAPEGTGVFYAHRMGATMPFELPQVIVYGDHVAPASVASAGSRVVVAYEDPNTGGRPYVSLALSRTAGHTWAERFAVSSGSESATRPAVALRGREVAVAWMVPAAPRALQATDDPFTATVGGGIVVVRVGRLRL